MSRLHSKHGLGIIVLALLALVLPGAAVRAQSVNDHRANIAAVASGDDFATQVLNNPWDFNEADDVDFWFTRTLGGLNGLSVENGVLTATAANGDPRVWIRSATPAGATIAPYEGSYRPLRPADYSYATVRMFVSEKSSAQFFYATAGGALGGTSFKDVLPGWNIITFDMNDRGFGSSGPVWSSVPTADNLYFDPIANQPNRAFTIDFIRFSTKLTTVPITWNGNGLNGDVDILVGTDANDATKIATVPGNTGSLNWQTSLAAGAYQVFVRQGSTNVGGSPFALPVNATPQLQITAPSYISGPDYATTVMGNPWDMNDVTDVRSLPNIVDAKFTNGIFRGVNRAGSDDPVIDLRVTTPIDTSRFKYATYRMQVDTLPTPINAPVARYLWYNTRPEDAGTTQDIVVYEGFRTVSYDLTKIDLEPEAPGPPWNTVRPDHFRFDPHEYTEQKAFQIDYIMLTANDRADKSFSIRYNTADANGGNLSVQFFYGTDSGGAGGTPIQCSNAQANVAASNATAYLPLITNGSTPPVVPGGASCIWNSASVPNGTYHIYGVVSDGVDSTRVVSETPVEIAR